MLIGFKWEVEQMKAFFMVMKWFRGGNLPVERLVRYPMIDKKDEEGGGGGFSRLFFTQYLWRNPCIAFKRKCFFLHNKLFNIISKHDETSNVLGGW